MKPKKLIKSFGNNVRVIGASGSDAEAYLIDADGKKWHVRVQQLPQYVDVGIPNDPGKASHD